MKKLLAVVIPCMLATAVNAETYVLADMGQVNYKVSSISFDTNVLRVGVGSALTDVIAVELSAGTGISGDDLSDVDEFYRADNSFKTSLLVALELKAGLPITDKVKAIGNIGYSFIKIKNTGSAAERDNKQSAWKVYESGSVTEDDGMLGFGIGLQYQFDQKISLQAKYSEYGDFEVDDADIDVSGLRFSAAYQF